jgi:hypothetical protein
MPDPTEKIDVTFTRAEFDLVFDALRFAHEDFIDEKGSTWSDDEYDLLQEVIDRLEELLFANSSTP